MHFEADQEPVNDGWYTTSKVAFWKPQMYHM